MKTNYNSVEAYIESFPKDLQMLLTQVRNIIMKNAPQATETIAYGMPAYKTHGKPLVYFSGFKNHIGFYATPTGHEAFHEALSQYKQGKGSVQFPLDQPIPFDLIAQIVLFRVTENEQKFTTK